MNIGKQGKPMIVEPAVVPVPQRETRPARPSRPAPARREPSKTPGKAPKKVPSR